MTEVTGSKKHFQDRARDMSGGGGGLMWTTVSIYSLLIKLDRPLHPYFSEAGSSPYRNLCCQIGYRSQDTLHSKISHRPLNLGWRSISVLKLCIALHQIPVGIFWELLKWKELNRSSRWQSELNLQTMLLDHADNLPSLWKFLCGSVFLPQILKDEFHYISKHRTFHHMLV